jgi:hypothetical protein
MDQLKGSLRFIPLPAVTQFIAGLGSTGRLQITQGTWSGEIALGNGQVVGAQLGTERGRPALEGLVLALTEANFAFVDGPHAPDAEPLLSRDELAGYMAGLVAERERLQPVIGMLNSVPCLIDQPASGGSESGQVTIQAAALQLIPALVYGHTLEQIALRRGLARTLREVAALRNGGLVRLEVAPAAPPMPAPTLQVVPPPAPAPADQDAAPRPAQAPAPADQDAAPRPAQAPAPADQDTARRPAQAPASADQEAARRPAPPRTLTPPTLRPLRPVPTEPRPAAQPPRRAGWWQTSSAAPATIETPRPRLVTDEPRPHLEPVRLDTVRQAADRPEADRPEADRPEADRPEADRPEADRPEADRPEADRPEADRPEAHHLDLPRSEPGRAESEASAPAHSERGDSLPRSRSLRNALLGLFVAESSSPEA